MSNIIILEKYAFVHRSFSNVTTLILRNLAIRSFHMNTFSGLQSLRTLKFYSLQNMDFAPGFLSAITSTLRYFITYGPEIHENIVHSLNPLTGGLTFPSLRTFKAQQNLRDSLNAFTFTGIINVRILVLSNCAIESIGVGTFEPIKSSLDKLYLDGNRLTWLSATFFNIFHPQGYFNLYLSNNLWHCNCDLEPMQQMLSVYSQAFAKDETILCKEPWHWTGIELEYADLCEEDNVTASSTPSISYEPTTELFYNDTPVSTPFTTPKYTSLFPQCPSALDPGRKEILYYYFNDFPFKLTPNDRGELLLTTTMNIDEWLVLIWFPSAQNSNLFIDQLATGNVTCFWQLHRNFLITNLVPNTAYTFCMMNILTQTITPFDCAAYYHRINSDEWNFWLNAQDYQVWIITAFAVGILLAFILECAWAYGVCVVIIIGCRTTEKQGRRKNVRIYRHNFSTTND